MGLARQAQPWRSAEKKSHKHPAVLGHNYLVSFGISTVIFPKNGCQIALGSGCVSCENPKPLSKGVKIWFRAIKAHIHPKQSPFPCRPCVLGPTGPHGNGMTPHPRYCESGWNSAASCSLGLICSHSTCLSLFSVGQTKASYRVGALHSAVSS